LARWPSLGQINTALDSAVSSLPAARQKYDLALNYRNCYDIKVDSSGVYKFGPRPPGFTLRRLFAMSGVHVTRSGEAQPYAPPHHSGVTARRHQGRQAGGGSPALVSTSTFTPTASADSTPTTYDTIYLILDGQLELSVDDRTETLGKGDSVFLPAGTVRGLRNHTETDARLVVVAVPPAEAAN
jgi:quercetin dioxygenase-like cupin family protein